MINSGNSIFSPSPLDKVARGTGDDGAGRVGPAIRHGGPGKRPPIIIEGVVSEAVRPPRIEFTDEDVKAAPRPKPGPTGRRGSRWPAGLGVAATLLLGVLAGYAAPLLLVKQGDNVQALVAANEELRRRVAALEQAGAAPNPQTGYATFSELRAEARADRAMATDKFDRISTRLEKVERDLAARATGGRDVTASIHALPAPAPAPPPQLGAPTSPKVIGKQHVPLGGWILREVRDGGALVEGAGGMRRVEPGDMLPGAGRVQRVERRGGQWVLVTAAGLIDMDEY